MKNKILVDSIKNMLECVLHAIVDTSGNYELKIEVNNEGFKVLKDNKKIDNFLTINTLMGLTGIFSLDDLDDELITEQLELFIGIANKILILRKEGKDEEKA